MLSSLEFASLDLIIRYVSSGFGVGLTLDIPGTRWPGTVKPLPLPTFPKAVFGAFINGAPNELINVFLEEVERMTRKMWNRLEATG